MMRLLNFLLLVTLVGCNNSDRRTIKKIFHKEITIAKSTDNAEKPLIHFSDDQLIAFLDSIGKLKTQPLADRVSHRADSVFKHLTKPVLRILSTKDFDILKKAIRDSIIEVRTARKIFGELLVDSNCTAKGLLDSAKKGSVYLQYYSFDKNKNNFNEFAVCVGDGNHCKGAELYFLGGIKLLQNRMDISVMKIYNILRLTMVKQ